MVRSFLVYWDITENFSNHVKSNNKSILKGTGNVHVYYWITLKSFLATWFSQDHFYQQSHIFYRRSDGWTPQRSAVCNTKSANCNSQVNTYIAHIYVYIENDRKNNLIFIQQHLYLFTYIFNSCLVISYFSPNAISKFSILTSIDLFVPDKSSLTSFLLICWQAVASSCILKQNHI